MYECGIDCPFGCFCSGNYGIFSSRSVTYEEAKQQHLHISVLFATPPKIDFILLTNTPTVEYSKKNLTFNHIFYRLCPVFYAPSMYILLHLPSFPFPGFNTITKSVYFTLVLYFPQQQKHFYNLRASNFVVYTGHFTD